MLPNKENEESKDFATQHPIDSDSYKYQTLDRELDEFKNSINDPIPPPESSMDAPPDWTKHKPSFCDWKLAQELKRISQRKPDEQCR